MAKRPQAVSCYLQHSDQFSSLHDTFSEDAKLLRQIRQQFPREITDHITALHRKGQVLTLHVDAPAWASKMRYLSRDIAENTGSREVKVRISPTHIQQHEQPGGETRRRHSEKAAEILSEAAGYTSDENLKAALLRLSRAVKPRL